MSEHKPPKHIFLQWEGINTEDMPEFDCPVSDGDITWSQDVIYDTDVKYIKANEAQAEIDRLTEALDMYRNGYQGACMACEPVGEQNKKLLGRLEARDAEIDRLTEACLRKDDILRIVGATPVGSWLSASLDDPHVCTEMKRDIRAWFAAMSIVEDELSRGEK